MFLIPPDFSIYIVDQHVVNESKITDLLKIKIYESDEATQLGSPVGVQFAVGQSML
ncbi:hypothetical protein T472_0218230 [Youngiibacter fragilis 232.1]|uniref:Uncharacterized protein n=1 Tax=Youngiibacter fragilis 232.1 TaxID=994573 RepID=V7HZV6_9CLOT|nr:hypothetical protein T472_0218230 [Youngiibacter fragilis 232.1]